MNDDYSSVFASLAASEVSAMSAICAHSKGLYQHKTNRRFQSLVGRGLVYTQSVKSGRGIRYKAYDPVWFEFKTWFKNWVNRGSIAS
jgi:hypothetical protein